MRTHRGAEGVGCRTCRWWGTANLTASIRLKAAGVCKKPGGPREQEAVVASEWCEAWQGRW
jgi:hypothetical protein